MAAQLSLLQRDCDDEAQGFAEKLLAGADEGVEVSPDWGSWQGGLSRAHDVSENYCRVDWLSGGEKRVGRVFQRLSKRIFDSNHDVRTAQKCSGQPSDLRQRRLDY